MEIPRELFVKRFYRKASLRFWRWETHHSILTHFQTLQSRLDGQSVSEPTIATTSRPSSSKTSAHSSTQSGPQEVTIFDRSNRRGVGRDPHPSSVSSIQSNQSIQASAVASQMRTLPASAEYSENSLKIAELSDKISEMENRLQNDFSLSEPSKYALKKEIAKTRANVMRLKRTEK